MAKLNPMIDMEMDDESQLAAVQPYPMPDKPQYPYGLRISLTEKEFEKLDIDPAEAFVGGTVHLHALATITSVSASDSSDGACCRCELQITHLMVESEDAENDAD